MHEERLRSHPDELLVEYVTSAIAASCALLAASPRCMTYNTGARICMNLHEIPGVVRPWALVFVFVERTKDT